MFKQDERIDTHPTLSPEASSAQQIERSLLSQQTEADAMQYVEAIYRQTSEQSYQVNPALVAAETSNAMNEAQTITEVQGFNVEILEQYDAKALNRFIVDHTESLNAHAEDIFQRINNGESYE